MKSSSPLRKRRRPLAAEALESRRLLAIDLNQVANINETNPWGNIRELVSVGNDAYFVASEPGSTRLDLWTTDGTTAGTLRLADVGPSSPLWYVYVPRLLTNVGGTLFFRGFDEAHGHELWKSDGTSTGTILVKDLVPGPTDSEMGQLVDRNGSLLFSANGHLYRSNGTAQGTVPLIDVRPGNDNVDNLAVVGNTVYFTAKLNDTGVDLFKSNGTVAGTVLVEDAGNSTIDHLANVSGTLFFVRDHNSLWKTAGTPAAAELVSDFSSAPFGAYPSQLTNVSGELFFASGGDIWKSNGTEAGTVFVDSAGLNAYDLFNMDGTLYFSGGTRPNLGHGYELWKSDGTAAGTFEVKDISPGFFEGYGDSSYPGQFTNFNGTLYFLASGGLWTTDGTTVGTVPVESGSATSLINYNGQLLFGRQTGGYNGTFSLWKSNGLAGEAVEIPPQGLGHGDANPSAPVNVNGTLYFAANDGIHGSELWKLAGGSAQLIKDIYLGSSGSSVSNLTNVNGTLYFAAYDVVRGQEVWKSDGTAEGTVRLSDIQGAGTTSPRDFTSVGSLVFFVAYDAEGQELWKSDGTEGGTTRIKDIFPGSTYDPDAVTFFPNSSAPSGLTNFGGTLFFTATDPVYGRELWKSDGTPGGTVIAFDLYPGSEYYYPYGTYSSSPSGQMLLNGSLYFAANGPGVGRGLWKSDGTLAGTHLIKGVSDGLNSPGPFTLVGDDFFFSAFGSSGEELWKSDGTPEGTVLVKDIRAGTMGSEPRLLTNVSGELFFVAEDGLHGRELWRSDGTASGTTLARDILEGVDVVNNRPLSSDPRNLANLNGVLFFSAGDGSHGRELWKSAGAPGDTTLVRDFMPGSVGSDPQQLAVIGNQLFLSADTPTGRELWKGVHQRPQLTIPAGVLSYTEGGSTLLASNAQIITSTTPVLNGGLLTVSLQNGRPGDRLQINAVGPISVLGNLVFYNYNSVIVGQFSGGSDGEHLRIRLNLNATTAAVQALVRSIAFASDSDNPALNRRTIRFDLADGQGGAAAPRVVQVDVTRVNDSSTIEFGGDLTYTENAAPVRIAASALVRDSDSPNLEGGRLIVKFSSGGVGTDRFAIRNAGLLTVVGNEVRWSDVPFGTFVGGSGTAALIIDLNALSTAGKVQALLRNIVFSSVSENPSATPRTLSARLTDGDGGICLVTKALTIVPVNDSPLLSGISGNVGYTLNASGWIQLAGTALVSDPDNANLNGGKLTVEITAGGDAGNRLQILGGLFTVVGTEVQRNGVAIGTLTSYGVGINKFEVTFNDQALSSYVQQLLRAIRFRTQGSTSAANRVVSFSLTDGSGGTSAILTKTVLVS